MRRALLALALLVPIGWATTSGGPAAALPAGFADELVVDLPGTATAVEALPDGRVVVLEQGGVARLVDARSTDVQIDVLLTLDVCDDSERGLLGFTHDPDFFTNGFVYLYYTIPSGQPGGCHNRVSRFTMSGSTIDRASEQVLVDDISSVNGNHNGGDLEVGNDGYLYIAIGDAGRDPRGDSGSAGSNDAAQDLSLLNGKILRVDRSTGVAAPGNPFTGADTADCRLRGNTAETPTTTCREIYAYGLRNPYRFAFDPNTSATRFFVNDVGQGTREEVDEGIAGANYGWPLREGQCAQGLNPPCEPAPAGLVDPITDYGRDLGVYVTAGAFVPDGVWPEEYDGGYLFADGGTGRIWLRDASGDVDYGEPFHVVSAPTDMTFVNEPGVTTLWYARQDGAVHRITPPLDSQPTDSGPLHYEALPVMSRRFDSRQGDQAAPLRGGTTRLVDLSADASAGDGSEGDGVPDGAVAAVVTVTLVRPAVDGAYATVWAPRTGRPTTSNLNAPAATVVANSSVVPLDGDGRMLLHVPVTTHVVVDVAGFFVPAPDAVTSGRLETVEPLRLVDSRRPADGEGNPYLRDGSADSRGDVVAVPIAGRGGLPDAGSISAVVVVVTGINRDDAAGGYATIFPAGGQVPLASSVNVSAAPDQRANLAIVPLGDGGSVEVLLAGVEHVALDVVGWFGNEDAEASTDGRFHLVVPTREADSRRTLGLDPFEAGDTQVLDPGVVPESASAIAQNLTLAPSGGRGFVTAFPGGELPTVSNLNASAAGQVRAALAFTALGDGSESLYADAPTDLLVDAFGWFE